MLLWLDWRRNVSVEAPSTEAYWSERFAVEPPRLALPGAGSHTGEGDASATGRVEHLVSDELLEPLRELAAGEGWERSSLLLAAWVALLHRLSGDRDLVVAVPTAGPAQSPRDDQPPELPLRLQIAGEASFRELSRSVASELSEAREHPLVDRTLLRFGHTRFGVEPAAEKHGAASQAHLISLAATESDDRLVLVCTYDAALLADSTIGRWLQAYERLLAGALAEPDRELGALPVIPEQDREALAGWNARAVTPYPRDVCVHEMIEAQAARTPDRTALHAVDKTLTFAELDARANQIAARLRTLGVTAGSLVGVCLDRSSDMVASVLAVLKAGGAYVPIDPRYPAERVVFMLVDAGAPVLITESKLLDDLPATEAKLLVVDAEEPDSPDLRIPPPTGWRAATPEDRAYVIYTSGSTGKPKGVEVPHRAVVNHLLGARDMLGIGEDDVMAATTTLSFDPSVFQVLLPLVIGAQLVLATRGSVVDGRAISRLLKRHNVTVMSGTPSFWRLLLAIDWPGMPTLKAVSGAEKLTPEFARELLPHVGSLWNIYGPTETTVFSNSARIEAPVERIVVGPAAPNTRHYVLNEFGQQQPIGVSGEIFIGGAGVALGYLNRPELTAERFVPDSFFPGERMYATGDIGRIGADGMLECLGRRDNQVKLRGFRIELGEIETVLADHPAIDQAVVIVREDHPGDQRLVAYLVARPGEDPDDAGLLGHARDRLPDYMVPRHLVWLASLPLTPHRKVDRDALPAPVGGLQGDADYAPPSTDLERSLEEIWRELLNLDRVSVDGNFFALGGHSLLAVQVALAVEERLGRTCTLPMVFRAPTIRRLAAELHAGGGDANERTVLQLQPEGSAPALFCICGVHLYQELADALAPETPVYGIFLPSEQDMYRRGRQGTVGLSVEETAAGYVEAVREQQPTGPYLLTGSSFGGVLAYEMAQQLVRAGEEVGLLVVLDTVLPSAMKRFRPRQIAEKVFPFGPFAAPDLTETERLGQMRDDMYIRAVRRYAASPYAGSMLLVRARETLTGSTGVVDPMYGWSGLVPNLELEDISGDHLGILGRPAVEELAEAFRTRIARAVRS